MGKCVSEDRSEGICISVDACWCKSGSVSAVCGIYGGVYKCSCDARDDGRCGEGGWTKL